MLRISRVLTVLLFLFLVAVAITVIIGQTNWGLDNSESKGDGKSSPGKVENLDSAVKKPLSTGPQTPNQAAEMRQSQSLPPLDTPVASYFSSLKEKALAGDARAACRIAFDMGDCTESIANERRRFAALSRQADTANPSFLKSEADILNERVIPAVRSNLKRLEARCQGFALSQDERPIWQYVLISAQNGNVSAMTRFVYGVDVGLNPDLPAASPEAWMAYRQYTPFLLESALSKGDSFAFYLAGRAHQGVEATFGLKVFEQDPASAIKYYTAAAERATGGSAKLLERTIEDIVKKSKVPPDVVDRSRQLGRALAATPASSSVLLDIQNSIVDGALPPSRCEE